MYTWIWIPIVAGVLVISLAILGWLMAARLGAFRRTRRSGPAQVRGDRRNGISESRGVQPRSDTASKVIPDLIRKKTSLPKEVEIAWEASEIIDIQPGAYARTGKEPAPWEKPGTPRETPISQPAVAFDIPVSPAAEGASRAGGDRGFQPSRAPSGPGGELEPGDRPAREERYQLPSRYGVDRLVLMARDPYWLYAYWEVTHQKYAEMRDRHLREWDLSRPLLRLQDITPGVPQEQRYLDVYITDDTDNWYIHVGRPRHTLFAEIGRLLPHSVFVPLVRSNVVTMPSDSVSEEISEEWAPVGWPGRYPGYRREIGLSSPWAWGRGT
ncbi:MAG: DUF4912 domain-containing protein [Firmicutes bacterium]|nr:DUF4912 domain-containing protein [Candidatus Fermentithermobacillaceae bacterium]